MNVNISANITKYISENENSANDSLLVLSTEDPKKPQSTVGPKKPRAASHDEHRRGIGPKTDTHAFHGVDRKLTSRSTLRLPLNDPRD